MNVAMDTHIDLWNDCKWLPYFLCYCFWITIFEEIIVVWGINCNWHVEKTNLCLCCFFEIMMDTGHFLYFIFLYTRCQYKRFIQYQRKWEVN